MENKKNNTYKAKRYRMFMGFEYPNSILFALLFSSIGLFGLYDLITQLNRLDVEMLFSIPFILVLLTPGLFSFGSYKRIELDFDSNTITIGIIYFFLFFKGDKFELSNIEKIKIVKASGGYSVGGGFLVSARNSFNKKETNVFFYSYGSSRSIYKLEDIAKNKISRLIEIISSRTNIKIIS